MAKWCTNCVHFAQFATLFQRALFAVRYRALFINFVDQAKFFCVGGRHKVVAFERLFNRFVILARVLNINLIQATLEVFCVSRMDQNIRRGA